MDWPTNSSDFNLIENLWFVLKHCVEKQIPRNVADLREFILGEWGKITRQEVQNLIWTIPTQLEKCIEVGGQSIDY
jgi:hypothetical protein